VEGKLSVYDCGVPIELSAATNFQTVSHVYASEIRIETFQHFLASIKSDVHRAFVRDRSQAREGMVYAQFLLGLDYWYGRGTETNQALAFHWIQIAAVAGDPEAKEFIRTNSPPHQ
jgi:hypothetical protein